MAPLEDLWKRGWQPSSWISTSQSGLRGNCRPCWRVVEIDKDLAPPGSEKRLRCTVCGEKSRGLVRRAKGGGKH